MPGSRDRPPFFVSKEWREYYADMQTPEDAGYLKITWSWTSPPEAGEINGVMFFDDATLIGEKVEVPEEPEPTPEGTPAAPAGKPAVACAGARCASGNDDDFPAAAPAPAPQATSVPKATPRQGGDACCEAARQGKVGGWRVDERPLWPTIHS